MNFKKSIKAQAALEFLTTYGWAFLIILIMIGTLAYFGILNPVKLVPDRCNFASEFQCGAYRIREGGSGVADEFRFSLKNNVGEAITVIAAPDMRITNEAGTVNFITGTCTLTPARPFSWNPGESREFVLTGTGDACAFATNGMTPASKGKLLIEINYYKSASGTSYNTIARGEIVASVT